MFGSPLVHCFEYVVCVCVFLVRVHVLGIELCNAFVWCRGLDSQVMLLAVVSQADGWGQKGGNMGQTMAVFQMVDAESTNTF